MIRDVDLVSYLPPFLAEFKEDAVTLEAENPEFRLVWEATDRVLKNEFIATADEYGISRFEKLLHIFPSNEDTLKSRRTRVQARWFSTVAYTLKGFIAKLAILCGDSDFTVIKDYLHYRVEIETSLELFGQIEELEHIINSMIPCNIVIVSDNKISCEAKGFALITGGVCVVEQFFVTNDNKENVVVNGSASHGGGAINNATVIITNDFNEQFNISGKNSIGSGVVISEFIKIKL